MSLWHKHVPVACSDAQLLVVRKGVCRCIGSHDNKTNANQSARLTNLCLIAASNSCQFLQLLTPSVLADTVRATTDG